MGRGDQRSRSGKVFAKSHGKTRPRNQNRKNKPATTAGRGRR
jgi:ribosomal small subunit protein bTHX